MIGKWFKKIGISSKKEFIPIFSRQAEFLVQEARLLVEMVTTPDNSIWSKNVREIKSCEVQGDAILTEFFEQLSEKLIFSINKIDLQTVAMAMDDCLDAVKNASKAIVIYNPLRIDSHIKDLAHIILEETEVLSQMLPLLGEIKTEYRKIVVCCDRVKELEHTADDVYEEYIASLFREEEDFREMIKNKNIAEVFENTTDAGKRVSDLVRKLLLNYIQEKL